MNIEVTVTIDVDTADMTRALRDVQEQMLRQVFEALQERQGEPEYGVFLLSGD